MKSTLRIWSSVIEYAVDLTDRSSTPIFLGAACEVELPTAHVIGWAARERLLPAELRRLDDIGRELLASPRAAIQREIEAALPSAPGESPGILRALVARSDWSFRFRSPVAREARIAGDPVTILRRDLDALFQQGTRQRHLAASRTAGRHLGALVALTHRGDRWTPVVEAA